MFPGCVLVSKYNAKIEFGEMQAPLWASIQVLYLATGNLGDLGYTLLYWSLLHNFCVHFFIVLRYCFVRSAANSASVYRLAYI